jgi:hypothetical protein
MESFLNRAVFDGDADILLIGHQVSDDVNEVISVRTAFTLYF